MAKFGVQSWLKSDWELIPESIKESKEAAEKFAEEMWNCVDKSKFKYMKNKFRVVKFKNRDLRKENEEL